MDITVDGHVHTYLCNHAVGSMEEYVQAALERGLRKIIFLEHMEAGIDYIEQTWLTDGDFDLYFKEGEKLRDVYEGRIEIGLGVEVGYNPSHSTTLVNRLADYKWDRIGVSCHFYKPLGYRHHLNLLSRKKANTAPMTALGTEKLLTAYFETLLEAVVVLPGDVLCHLDAALRFVPQLTYTEEHLQQIEKILNTVKQKNMALEVNTSGIDIRRSVFPAEPILMMAKEKDITLVAGSDAHRPEDVGRYFSSLASL